MSDYVVCRILAISDRVIASPLELSRLWHGISFFLPGAPGGLPTFKEATHAFKSGEFAFKPKIERMHVAQGSLFYVPPGYMAPPWDHGAMVQKGSPKIS